MTIVPKPTNNLNWVLRKICILRSIVLQTSHPFSERTGFHTDLFDVFRGFSKVWGAAATAAATAATATAATTTEPGTSLANGYLLANVFTMFHLSYMHKAWHRYPCNSMYIDDIHSIDDIPYLSQSLSYHHLWRHCSGLCASKRTCHIPSFQPFSACWASSKARSSAREAEAPPKLDAKFEDHALYQIKSSVLKARCVNWAFSGLRFVGWSITVGSCLPSLCFSVYLLLSGILCFLSLVIGRALLCWVFVPPLAAIFVARATPVVVQ